jgi:N-dimethylarginine dimethylaminohydrolase
MLILKVWYSISVQKLDSLKANCNQQPATPTTIIVYANETTMTGQEKRERLAIL